MKKKRTQEEDENENNNLPVPASPSEQQRVGVKSGLEVTYSQADVYPVTEQWSESADVTGCCDCSGSLLLLLVCFLPVFVTEPHMKNNRYIYPFPVTP